MKVCYDYVIDELKKKESVKFTGVMRFGVEENRLVAIAESTGTDFKTAVMPAEEIRKNIADFCHSCNFGSMVVIFEGGTMARFGYAKTHQGTALKKYLGLV